MTNVRRLGGIPYAKVRTGGPNDDAEDMSVPVWAGVLPVRMEYGPPEASPDLDPAIEMSPVVSAYRRPARSG